MKKYKNSISALILLTTLILTGCRDWFGEDNQPSSIVGNEILPEARIEITSPEYASVWNPGDTLLIKWVTSNPIERVDIELYRKTAFQFNLAKNKVSEGFFSWEIPEAINHSVHYKIKIINHDRQSEYTISKSFAIRD